MLVHNRARMRATNKMVRDMLLEYGFDEIWFKSHTARNDLIYTQKATHDYKKPSGYYATDLWNLFDGMCWGKDELYFLQMKTNSWAAEKPIKDFLKKRNGKVMVFNVTNKLKECKGKWKVFFREYSS